MTEMQAVAREGLVSKFLNRVGLGGFGTVGVLENPTEEIVHGELSGRRAKLSLWGAQQRKKPNYIRREENYLWSTRRFPLNTANNTIGSGAVAAGDYDFFGQGIGDAGNTHGYFSLTNLTPMQTNMDKGGKIPQGRGFAMFELAVSFNAEAIGADIAQLLDTAALRYEKQAGQLVIQHGPIRQWPGGTGISGYATTTATTTTKEAASSGVPSLTSNRRFQQPRLLNANESFKYVVNAAATKPKDNVAVALSAFVEMSVWLFGWTYDRIPE